MQLSAAAPRALSPWQYNALAEMGKNKHTRKVIAGYHRTIIRHEEKIAAEAQRSSPDSGLLEKWEKEIDAARKQVRKLEKRLER